MCITLYQCIYVFLLAENGALQRNFRQAEIFLNMVKSPFDVSSTKIGNIIIYYCNGGDLIFKINTSFQILR